MSKVTLIKDDTGKLRGIDPAHERAYQKWRKQVLELQVGDTLGFSYRMPRSPGHHRKFFAKLNALLARTEAFTSLDPLRYWLTMGAGYFDLIPGRDGTPNAIPRSIDFDSMDEAEFSELHRSVDDFLMTDRALTTLWPALPPAQRLAMAESLVREFM